MNFLKGLLMVACLSAAVSGYKLHLFDPDSPIVVTTPEPITTPGPPAPPCTKATEGKFFPEPSNCNEYWRCTNNKSWLEHCPATLVWNTKKNYCDYVSDTDTSHCHLEAASDIEDLDITTKPTTKEPSTPKPKTTGPPASTTPGPPAPPCTKATEGQYIPEPSDCNEFWRCTDSISYLEHCPATLVWNTKLNLCDYVSDTDTSHCHLEAANSDAEDLDITTKPTTKEPSTPKPKTSGPPASTTPGPPAPPCTKATEGQYIPEPSNCNEFWRCTDSISYLEHCPATLVWNTKFNLCDYVSHTDTSHCHLEAADSDIEDLDTTTKPTTKDPSTPAPKTTGPPASTTPGPPAPPCTKATEGQYLPEPSNCNEFWRCTDSISYLEHCPATLVWNTNSTLCDYVSHTDTSHCVMKLRAAPKDAPACDTQHEGDFYPDPQDCHKYYRCTDEISVLQDCKGQLVWNTKLDTCDYPYRTDTSHCAMKLLAAPKDTPACDTQHEGAFYPDPQDCHKYYRCTDKISVLEDCPSQLVWNTKLDTCDYAYRTDTSHCGQ